MHSFNVFPRQVGQGNTLLGQDYNKVLLADIVRPAIKEHRFVSLTGLISQKTFPTAQILKVLSMEDFIFSTCTANSKDMIFNSQKKAKYSLKLWKFSLELGNNQIFSSNGPMMFLVYVLYIQNEHCR